MKRPRWTISRMMGFVLIAGFGIFVMRYAGNGWEAAALSLFIFMLLAALAGGMVEGGGSS